MWSHCVPLNALLHPQLPHPWLRVFNLALTDLSLSSCATGVYVGEGDPYHFPVPFCSFLCAMFVPQDTDFPSSPPPTIPNPGPTLPVPSQHTPSTLGILGLELLSSWLSLHTLHLPRPLLPVWDLLI